MITLDIDEDGCGPLQCELPADTTAEEVAYIVDNCDAQVFIASTAKRDVALAAAAMTPKVRVFLMVDAERDEVAGVLGALARARPSLPD